MPRIHMKVSFIFLKCVKVRVGMRLRGCTHHPNRYVAAVGTIGWAGRAIPHNTCTSTFTTVKSNIEFQVSYRLVMSNNSLTRHRAETKPIKDTRASAWAVEENRKVRAPQRFQCDDSLLVTDFGSPTCFRAKCCTFEQLTLREDF